MNGMIMYYSNKTGEKVETPPVSGSDEWVDLPSEYDWITWDFDHPNGEYKPKSAGQLQAESDVLKNIRMKVLWNAVNDYSDTQMDANSRHSINLYLVDPLLTETRRNKILSYAAWWKSLWEYYAAQKALIIAGQDAAFDPSVVGPCPYTIWDIAG